MSVNENGARADDGQAEMSDVHDAAAVLAIEDRVRSKVIENRLRTGLRLDRRYGGTPATRVRDHDSERRDKPMIPMITALVSFRGADRV